MSSRLGTGATPPTSERLAGAPHLRLAPEPASPARARAFVTRNCPFEGDVREAARLLVSELATNVVLHARTPMDIALLAEDDRLVIAVSDASHEVPRPFATAGDAAPPTEIRLDEGSAEHGRGLAMLDQLPADWGIVRHASGKTVWCVLPVHPHAIAGNPGPRA